MRYRLRTLLLFMLIACPLAAIARYVGLINFAGLVCVMLPVLLVPAIGFIYVWRTRL
jgi:hypothetical protein